MHKAMLTSTGAVDTNKFDFHGYFKFFYQTGMIWRPTVF